MFFVEIDISDLFPLCVRPLTMQEYGATEDFENIPLMFCDELEFFFIFNIYFQTRDMDENFNSLSPI